MVSGAGRHRVLSWHTGSACAIALLGKETVYVQRCEAKNVEIHIKQGFQHHKFRCRTKTRGFFLPNMEEQDGR